MPVPTVDPRPSGSALRLGAPEEEQEASYLAASARMRSFLASFSSMSPSQRFLGAFAGLFVFCSSMEMGRWRGHDERARGRMGPFPSAADLRIPSPGWERERCRVSRDRKSVV